MPPPSDDDAPRHRLPGRGRRRGRRAPGRHTHGGPAGDCGCPPGFHEHGAHAPGAWPDADISPPPPGAYPVENLAALSPGAADLLVNRAQTEADLGAPAHPHLVISRDARSGEATYHGPFPTGVEALTFARSLADRRAADAGPESALVVAPLFSQ